MFLIKLFFLSFVYWDPFLILKDSLISNEAFHLAFWYLLYSATFMFLRQPGICQFTSSNFHIIPYWSPWTSPFEKLFLSLTLENIFNFFYFLWWFKQSPSREWDNVLETSNRKYLIQFIKRRSKFHQRICSVKTL